MAVVEPIQMFLEIKARPHYGTKSQAEVQEMDAAVDYNIRNHLPFIAISDGQAVVLDGPNRTVVG